MGMNTIVLLLNDMMDSLEKSPKTAAYHLYNPPMDGRRMVASNYNPRFALTPMFNEPVLHRQALQVMPTYHADDTHFLRAGGNELARVELAEYGFDRKTGRKFAKVWLEEWMTR